MSQRIELDCLGVRMYRQQESLGVPVLRQVEREESKFKQASVCRAVT